MPIISIQRRLREAGRIRTGQKAARGNPVKLDTLRFTSADRQAIEAVAKLYGGNPMPWESAPVGEQWECVTDTATIPVVVPSAEMSFSQYLELWSAGGCARRCDGERELLSDKPCLCDPDDRQCRPTTRLSVMLPELENLGTWRIESHGWNAATELLGSIDLLRIAAERGRFVPADLRLEQRQSKKDGKTHNFAVPVLDLRLPMGALVDHPAAAALNRADNPLGSSGQTARPALTPVPTDDTPAPSVAEQLETANGATRTRRANSGPELPSTGRKPRPAAEVDKPGPPSAPVHPPADRLPPSSAGRASASQKSLNYLRIKLKTLGVTADQDVYDLVSAYINRDITSTKELTQAEASTAIKMAEEAVAQG